MGLVMTATKPSEFGDTLGFYANEKPCGSGFESLLAHLGGGLPPMKER